MSISSTAQESQTFLNSPPLPYIVSPQFIKKLQIVLKDSFGTPRRSLQNSVNNSHSSVTGNYSYYVFPGDKQYFDLYRVSNRVNHVFYSGSDGSQQFSTLYFVIAILAIGLLFSLVWLATITVYNTMRRILSLCPKRSKSLDRRDKGDFESSIGSGGLGKDVPTIEKIEQRRQEKMWQLHLECQALEKQIHEEKSQGMTSRASDSDLEFLGTVDESPRLKRNSISLQDIPQSVLKIRRDKQLRKLKDEIENLQTFTRQSSLKEIRGVGSVDFLKDDDPYVYRRESNKWIPPKKARPQPYSEHHEQVKTERKLHNIRKDLEDLAINVIHADEIRAKTASVGDIPKTAMMAKRLENLMTISKEIENIKNYKLHRRNIIHAVLQAKSIDLDDSNDENSLIKKEESGGSLYGSQNVQVKDERSAKSSGNQSPVPTSVMLRTRQQQLHRVRVELKELSEKLSMKPFYGSADTPTYF